MLPAPLVSLYQQYKGDTDAVAAWLASTATKLGFTPPSGASPEKNAQWAPRLKSKARRAAKESKESAGVEKKKATHIIAISDFVPLASHIASSHRDGSAVSIPDAFTATLDRVIALRTKFGATLNEHGVAGSRKSDESHLHFIGVLEKVRATLGPLFASPENADEERVGNQFAALHLHEPSQDFLDAPDRDPPRPPQQDGAEGVYEIETTRDGALFAFSVVMYDIYRLRSTVKWMWGNYRDGHLELASVALATNTALDLAGDLMEDVLPHLKGYDTRALINIHYGYLGAARGLTEADLYTDDPNDNFNYDAYDVADDAMTNAFRLLDGFSEVVQPGSLPLYVEGRFGTYYPASDRSKKTGHEKFVEDRVLLIEFFTELATISMTIDYPVEDEFLRGMNELIKTKRIPLYLVLAAQVFLDIHHELREKAKDAFIDLFREVIATKLSLTQHFDYHKDLKIKTWTRKHDAELHVFHKKLVMMMDDPVYESKVRFLQKVGRPVPDAMDRHRVYKRSPLLSGLLLYQVRAEMLMIGINVSNTWGSIMYSGHLYDAMQNENMLNHSWPDMDLAETILGTSNFYIGDRPTTLEQFNKKFSLQMGASAAAVSGAKSREGRKMPRIADMTSKSGPRAFKVSVPVSDMFIGRYVSGERRVNWTAEHVENVISRSNYEAEGSLEQGTLMMAKTVKSGKARGKRPEHGSRQETAGNRTPEDLIKALVFALQSEAVELSFPYLAFHRVCWDMLRAVHDACRQALLRSWGVGYLENESQLPFVVGYIFMDASGLGAPPDPTLLVTAARAMDEELAKGTGDSMIRTLRKGRISISISGGK